MVVFSLYKYVLSKRIDENVSLKDLSNRYKKEFNRTPVIVVQDIMLFSPYLYSLRGGIYGGQWSEYYQHIKKIVRRLQSLDINFIFYFDGSSRETSESEMQYRNSSRATEMISKFEKLRNGTYTRDKDEKLPTGIPSFLRYMLKYEFGCCVRNSTMPLRQEISRYASNTRDCIGIISNDSDYLIFETKPLLNRVDTDDLTADLFRRSKLIEVSELSSQQLPLLACMAGNSVMGAKDLEMFHRELSLTYLSGDRYHIDNVVQYIRRRRWTASDEEVPEIAKTLHIEENLLREGLSFYRNTVTVSSEEEEEDELLMSLQERCIDCSFPSPLYTLLHEKKLTEGESMEDPFDEQLPPSANIYRCVRQRMYSLLFERKPIEVEEYCVYKDKKNWAAELITPLHFSFAEEIPPLKELLSGEVHWELRWKLLVACMGITIPVSCLKSLEPRLVAMSCLLNFLIHNQEIQLESWEVKSFIFQAINPHFQDITYISGLPIEKIFPRAVSLSGIFFRGVTTIIKVIPVCGYPIPFAEAMPWKYLEGEVFHYAYNVFKSNPNSDWVLVNLFENNSELLKGFYELYRIAVMGTRLDNDNSYLPNE